MGGNMSSERQIAANRRNGKMGDGPKNTSLTKHNATKHGLRAPRLTPLDDREEYERLLAQLEEDFQPANCFDQMLIEKAALYAVKATTAEKLENQFLKSQLDPRVAHFEQIGDLTELFGKEKVLNPGSPAVVNHGTFERLVLYQRYHNGFMNLLYRTMHELERRHMRRRGERVSPPQVLDVSLPSGSIQDGTSTRARPSSASECISSPQLTTDAQSVTNVLNTPEATSEQAHQREPELIRAELQKPKEEDASGNRISLEAEGSKPKGPEASPPWQRANPKPLWST